MREKGRECGVESEGDCVAETVPAFKVSRVGRVIQAEGDGGCIPSISLVCVCVCVCQRNTALDT